MQSRFLHLIPYSTTRSLAVAYNEAVKAVDSSVEWILFTDADVMFLTPNYGSLLTEAIERYPEAGLLTCTTNRIGAAGQLTEAGKMNTSDLLELRKVALERLQRFGSATTKINPPVSGLFMLFRRTAWEAVGGFKGDGLYGVDWRFSHELHDAGFPIYRMDGLFVAHFYRMDGKGAI